MYISIDLISLITILDEEIGFVQFLPPSLPTSPSFFTHSCSLYTVKRSVMMLPPQKMKVLPYARLQT